MNIRKIIIVLAVAMVIALGFFALISYNIVDSIQEKHEKAQEKKQELFEPSLIKIDGENRYNMQSLPIDKYGTAFRVEPGARIRYSPENPEDEGKNPRGVKNVYIRTVRGGKFLNITNTVIKKTITSDTVWFFSKPGESQIIDVYYLKPKK